MNFSGDQHALGDFLDVLVNDVDDEGVENAAVGSLPWRDSCQRHGENGQRENA